MRPFLLGLVSDNPSEAAVHHHGELHAGYDGAVAIEWLRGVGRWSGILACHPQLAEFVRAVTNLSIMLSQAMSRSPDIPAYAEAAKMYHVTMLTHFPKVQPRIYEHALLVHVPELLKEGSLLDGSSWFLEAFNKVWKHQLLHHTNFGGGAKPEAGDPRDRRREKGRAKHVAWMAARMDRTALASLWTLTDPRVAARATQWVPSQISESVQLAYQAMATGRAEKPVMDAP